MLKLMVDKAPEGTVHRFTVETEDGLVSTMVQESEGELTVDHSEVSEFFLTLLASGAATAAITLETAVDEQTRVARCWLLDRGEIHGALAQEARDAALQEGLVAGTAYRGGEEVVFRDAPRLTEV